MKIIPLIPNTHEWESFRRLHIGASDCAAICGVDPYKKPKKLWEQKFRGDKQFVSAAMKRGTELEPKARAMVEKADMLSYPSLVVQHDEYDWMIASLDGFNLAENRGIEIKCPGEKIFNEVILEGKIPKSYIYQIQHQMCVTGCTVWTLVMFNGTYFQTISLGRDSGIIQEIIAKEECFYQSLINMEIPE